MLKTCTSCVHVIKCGTGYFISALIITVICDKGVKVVITSERLITRNGIFIKNGLIESPALSQDGFETMSARVYQSILLRCHYGDVTVKQSQLFSLRYLHLAS